MIKWEAQRLMRLKSNQVKKNNEERLNEDSYKRLKDKIKRLKIKIKVFLSKFYKENLIKNKL